MATATVLADNLSMTYRAPVREAGMRAALGALLHRRVREVAAVRALSFSVGPGEVVGFLGPNGAGKTTTLKMLAGVLHPTAGEARVLGHAPARRERAFLRRIAMVRGSRPLGAPGEVTVQDALRFQGVVYEVPAADYRRTLAELREMLDLGPLLRRQVRALSLGERMRCGLACALLYRPRVLFLDEPSIGLDATAVAQVRRFIGDYSRRTGATVLLTSHYMADVESLCRRIILIDRGALAYDGDLAGLAARLAPYKVVRVALAAAAGDRDGEDAPDTPAWDRFGEVLDAEGGRASLRVRREEAARATARLLAALPVADLSVEDPPLEMIIDRAYRGGVGPDTGAAVVDGAAGPGARA